MCGIAAIITGVPIIGSNLCRETKEALTLEAKKDYGSIFVTIDDLKAALQRRGPDRLDSRKFLIQLQCGNLVEKDDDQLDKGQAPPCSEKMKCSIASTLKKTGTQDVNVNGMKSIAQLDFIGAMLQLRGLSPVSQPLEDASGNLLVFNGSNSIKDVLDNEMVNEVTSSTNENCYWEELPCGIYSIELNISNENVHFMKEDLFGAVRKHRWTNPYLTKVISWDRLLLDPKIEDAIPIQTEQIPLLADSLTVHFEPAQRVLSALRRSVMRRTKMNSIYQTYMKKCGEEVTAPIAVLFSGGLDSMILSALLDQCLNSHYIIDLLNVSFDGRFAPDRVSARLGLRELQKVAPMRRWRLVEIDATLSNLTKETTEHVMSLIHPADTYMDFNIGLALWLAAGGDGFVDGHMCNFLQENLHPYKYKSKARVLLVGSGADEQCAGYGRHRTKYKHDGWRALHEEMRLDMQRIWKRNLGRDDRLISDHGKEARFPFLDEEVIQTLLEIPLWDIAKLDEPGGKGDKKILREVARLLSLEDAAARPKRAIQFGSRIARESNRKSFGSNRAANQASAGSVKLGQYAH